MDATSDRDERALLRRAVGCDPAACHQAAVRLGLSVRIGTLRRPPPEFRAAAVEALLASRFGDLAPQTGGRPLRDALPQHVVDAAGQAVDAALAGFADAVADASETPR